MKKFLIIGGIVLLICLAGAVWYAYFASYSEGFRVGRVMKISRKGIFFKTWEGQLNVEGILSDKLGSVSSTWEFSVEDSRPEVIQAINKAMDANKRVKLYYEEKFYTYPWRGDTKYLITKVEILD
ncbi:MAG: hypothetical protein RMJ44_12255 [Cytophagales bacterium]|nr:hypothetical protein [Bernardetiaceae bacterium]MDW8211846.1 hypothetical protein [Cytophagales bacterium]